MRFPISTGQVSRLLGVPEPRLNDLVRRLKIDPRPDVVAGRRQWDQSHIAQAAAALGLTLPPELAVRGEPASLLA